MSRIFAALEIEESETLKKISEIMDLADEMQKKAVELQMIAREMKIKEVPDENQTLPDC